MAQSGGQHCRRKDNAQEDRSGGKTGQFALKLRAQELAQEFPQLVVVTRRCNSREGGNALLIQPDIGDLVVSEKAVDALACATQVLQNDETGEGQVAVQLKGEASRGPVPIAMVSAGGDAYGEGWRGRGACFWWRERRLYQMGGVPASDA